MLRITQLKLPIGHAPDALKASLLARLKLPAAELLSFKIAKRAHDARKRSAITYIYTLDIMVADEAAVLARFSRDPDVKPAPDTSYKFVGRAPGQFQRPLVIGAGPCGLFAALLLAQMGFCPLVLERGKVVRERTKDTWAL